MGREITFVRGNVDPLSQFRITYWQPQETHRVCLPGAARGSAFRIQNKVLRLLRFCPLCPNLYRSGPDVRPEPRNRHWVQAMTMPRPRTQGGIGTQKAPRGVASSVDRAVRRTNGSLSGVKNVRCPGGAFKGMSGSGARAGSVQQGQRTRDRRGQVKVGSYGTGKERFLLLLYHTRGGEIKGGSGVRCCCTPQSMSHHLSTAAAPKRRRSVVLWHRVRAGSPIHCA